MFAPAIFAEKPYAEVSDKYSFVPTIAVIDMMKQSGWMPIFAKQSSTRVQEKDGYQRHMVRFRHSQDLSFDGGKERVDVVMHNSHDRGCAFNLLASIWRNACANGLMVSSDLYNFSHRHVGFSQDEFIESAGLITAGASEIAGEVSEMKAIELTPNERGIFSTAAHELVYKVPEEAPIKPAQLLTEKRWDDKGKDLWTTFNVVQENIMKGGLRGGWVNGKKKKKTQGVKSISKDVKLNKALWTLTEKMKELKLAA